MLEVTKEPAMILRPRAVAVAAVLMVAVTTLFAYVLGAAQPVTPKD